MEHTALVGDIGEMLGHIILLENGFTNVVNANDVEPNFPWADLIAVKRKYLIRKKKYLISSKTRNYYQNNGKPNTSIKLNLASTALHKAIKKYPDHIPAWLVIYFNKEPKKYDAYFGLVSDLPKNTGSVNLLKYGKCLFKDRPLGYRAIKYLNNR